MTFHIYNNPRNRIGAGGIGEVYIASDSTAHKVIRIGSVPEGQAGSYTPVKLTHVDGEALYLDSSSSPLVLDQTSQRRFHRFFTGTLCMLDIDDSPYVNRLAISDTGNPLSFFKIGRAS